MDDRIKDIGERGLLALFEKLVDDGDLPFNDDAVAFSLDDKQSIVVNIDTFVANTDAPPNMTSYQMGAKATTMAISDLAAKGVQPLYIIASGAFPEEYKTKDTIQLVKGIKDTGIKYGAKFLGGDTNAADDIILSVVALGISKKESLIKRNGANIGDLIYTTGNFGLTGAGFKVFIENYNCTKKQRERFYQAIYQPEARLKAGLLFAKLGVITSCIDSSDGLAWCLKELIRNKNECGIIIDNLPIDPFALEFAKNHKLNIDDLILYAGEEFELVFTINPKNRELVEQHLKNEDIDFCKIGTISSKHPSKLMLLVNGESQEIIPKGWEHFKDK
ncbi:MAG: thiamine-phosphate kinase [Asgard group archaeon]|nr:thiamine-phosphate kinase [Asgard group archaeon]